MKLYGQEIRRRPGKPDEIWMDCPFCQEKGKTPDTEKKLGVNLRTGQAHCFRCGWRSGGQRTFELLRMERSTEQDWMDLPDQEPGKKKIRFRLPEEFQRLRPETDREEELQQVWYYLRGRNVTVGQVERHRIGTCVSGRYEGRVIFPYWNVEGKLTGFIGRDWTGWNPVKYRNSDDFPRGWYGAEKIKKINSERTVVLVEGIFDKLSVERAGRMVLASLGKEVTEGQEAQLDGIRKFILFTDWDPDGVQRWMELGQRLMRNGRSVGITRPLEGRKDAGEMTVREVLQALDAVEALTAESALRMRIKVLKGAWTE